MRIVTGLSLAFAGSALAMVGIFMGFTFGDAGNYPMASFGGSLAVVGYGSIFGGLHVIEAPYRNEKSRQTET
jgi:hypothetical protein